MTARGHGVRWLWGAATALLLANVAVLALLILPARAQRLRQEDQLLELQRRIRALQRETQSSEGTLTVLREAEGFAQSYPRQAELVTLVGQIAQTARALALQVPAVTYKPEAVKEADLVKVTLTMAVEGPYGKIRRYLYDLEGLRHRLVIERLSIQDPGGTTALQAQLQLAVYVR